MRSSISVSAALAALVVSTPAQVQFAAGEIVLANDRSAAGIFVADPSGTFRPIQLSGFFPGTLAGCTATRLGELVIADYTTGNVALVQPDGRARVLGVVPGALRIAEDIDGSFLVTSFQTRSVERVTRTGQVSTVFALTSPSRPFDVVVDEDGDYVYCDDSGNRGVFEVDRTTGAVTALYTGSQLPLAHGLAFFNDGDLAVMDARNDEIYKLDRQTGQLTTFVSRAQLSQNPESIVESGDGGFFVALEFGGNKEVRHISSSGVQTTVAQTSGAPLTNVEQVAVVPTLTGPTGLAGGVRHPFRLEIPAAPNTVYLVGLSASIYPGLQAPGQDYGLAVNPDGLFLTTVTTANPVLAGFVGATDASGRASLAFDLSLLPRNLLSGRTFFAQGLTIDPLRPFNVGRITNPLRIDVR